MKRWKISSILFLMFFLSSIQRSYAAVDFVEGVKSEIQTTVNGISEYFSKNLGFVASGGRAEPTASLPEGTIIPINLAISINMGGNFIGKVSSIIEEQDVFKDYSITTDSRLPFLEGPSIYGRIGMNFIPVEIGFKYQIPVSSPSFIEDKTGFSFENEGWGIDIRVPLAGLGLVLASVDLAVGFAYNRMTGSMSIKKSSLENKGSISGTYGTFTINNLVMTSNWKINNYNPYIRLGAKIIIVRAYIELGLNLNEGETTTTLTGDYSSTAGATTSGKLAISSGEKKEKPTDVEIRAGANIPLFVIVGLNVEGRYGINSGNYGVNLALSFIF